MATVRNDRSGEIITDDLTHAEAAEAFLRAHPDNHWLHFWLHRYARDYRPPQPVVVTPSPNGNGTGHGITEGQAAQQFIADLFLLATGRGLKRPMIRLHFRDRRFKIYLSQRGTVCFKSGGLECSPCPDCSRNQQSGIRSHSDGGHELCETCCGEGTVSTNDPLGDEEYMGCLLGGRFLVGRWDAWNREYTEGRNYARFDNCPERPLLPAEREFLDQLLGANPIPFMAQCSKDMDRCCYCGQQLDDVRSKTLGYGQTCAKHWGLPWGHAKDIQNAPSFASLYCPEVAAFCSTIREAPTDPNRWAVFGDWLVEQGLPPLKIIEQVRETGLWVLKYQPFRMARTN